MESILNHDEFIENYQLSKNEYCLMPKEMRLTYADLLWRETIDEVKVKGMTYGRGYIKEAYAEYFEACGCEVINWDFGIEQFEIKSIREADFTPTEENKKLVMEYVKSVAEIRWTVYKTSVKYALFDALAKLSLENMVNPNFSINELSRILTDDTFSNELSDETKKNIIEIEITPHIKTQKEFEMNACIDKMYTDAIEAKGYSLEIDGNSIIAKILK